MPICDEITTYDNTKQIEERAYIVKGSLKLISENMSVCIDSIGFAYKNILESKKITRDFVKEIVVFKDHIEVTFNVAFSLLFYLNFIGYIDYFASTMKFIKIQNLDFWICLVSKNFNMKHMRKNNTSKM